jgi:hypothetical protein
MARTWILHTETKGTGAQMVPLDTVTKRPPSAAPDTGTERPSSEAPVYVRRDSRQPAAPTPESPPSPHRFRIVDVVTRETLVDDAGARVAAATLRDVRSPVDINIYVWREEPGRWRLLTFEEKRSLWDLRDA